MVESTKNRGKNLQISDTHFEGSCHLIFAAFCPFPFLLSLLTSTDLSVIVKNAPNDGVNQTKTRFNRCFCNYFAMFLVFIFAFTIFIFIFATEIHKTLIICGQNLVIQPY